MAKAPDVRRIADLEARSARLSQLALASGQQNAAGDAAPALRLAKTASIEDEYPEEDDSPDTYPIIFVDGTFTQEAGAQSVTWRNRQSEPCTVAHTVTEDADFIDEGTYLAVFNFRNRWWIVTGIGGGGSKQRVVKTTVAHAAGATETVDMWDGAADEVSDPLVSFEAINRTSTDIEADCYCLATKIDGHWFIEPWECLTPE